MPAAKKLTGLFKAAREGDLQEVRTLVGSGVDVNHTDGSGLSALFRASSKGHVEVIQTLLDAGAKLDVGIRSPLFMAMQAGHCEAVTLLYRAAEGNRRLLSGHIAYGERISPKWDYYSQKQQIPREGSCMHFAANNNLVSMVSLLCHLGEDVDCVHSGLTALHVAAARGRVRVLRELLTHGANPNKRTKKECTALHYAVYNGKPLFAIQALLEHGANPNAGDKIGNGSLHLIASRMDYLVDAKIFPLLLQHGADVNLQNQHGRSPLHYSNMLEMIKRLVANGADVNLKDFVKQETPLHRLAQTISSYAVKLLLDSGANVNARNINNMTPLHKAALQARLDTMQVLLNAGADVNIQDVEHSETPCHSVFTHFNQYDSLSRKHDMILKMLVPKIVCIQATSCFGTTVLDNILCGTNKDLLMYAKDLILLHRHLVSLNKPLYWVIPRFTIERYSLHTTASVLVTRFSPVDIKDIFQSLSDEKKTEFLQARNFLRQNSLHILLASGDCPQEDLATKIVLLLRLGVDPLESDINGRYPLHIASMHKRYSCIKILQASYPCSGSVVQDGVGRIPTEYEKLPFQLRTNTVCAEQLETKPGQGNLQGTCDVHNMISALAAFSTSAKSIDTLAIRTNIDGSPETFVLTMFNTPGLGFVDDTGENRRMRYAVNDLMETLMSFVAQLDPRFRCSVCCSGSTNPLEATKVGSLDEMDYVCLLDVFMGHCVVSHDSRDGRRFAVIKHAKEKEGVFSEFLAPNTSGTEFFAYERFIAHFWCLIMQALNLAGPITWYPLTVENCVRRNGFVGTFHLSWHGKALSHHRLTVDLVPVLRDQDWVLLLTPRYFDNQVVGDKYFTNSLELSSEVKDRELFVSLPEHVKDGYRVTKMLLNLFAEHEFVVDSKRFKAKDIIQSYTLKASLFWLLDPHGKFRLVYGLGADEDSRNPRLSLQKDRQTFHWESQAPSTSNGSPTPNQKHWESEIIYCRPCFHAISQELQEGQLPQKPHTRRPSQMTESDARPATFWALRIYQMLRYILQLKNTKGKPRDMVNYLLPFQVVRVRDRQLATEICDVFESILSMHKNESDSNNVKA